MKPTFALLLLALSVSAYSQDEVPNEITLTSGRVLRGVVILGVAKDYVILKSAAGRERVPYAAVKVPSPEAFKKAVDAKMERERPANEEAKRKLDEFLASVERERELDEILEKAARAGRLMKGQTLDHVRLIIGDSYKRNEYDSGQELQLIHRETTGHQLYIYLRDGRVTSWQRFAR